MVNHNSIAAMKAAQKSKEQEALGQSKWEDFKDWFNTKAVPALDKAVSSIHINWGVILMLVILTYMAKNGMLDDMPSIKWLVESAVRLSEWCFGLFRSFIGWFASLLDSKLFGIFDILGIFEWMANFLREIFAL